LKVEEQIAVLTIVFLFLTLSLAANEACGGFIEPQSSGLEGFYGYVKDKVGNPIQGATVSYGWKSNTTDANGYYEIFIGHLIGEGDLNCSKTGFFNEIIHNSDPQGGSYDFCLSDNPATMVTIVALFPNTPDAYEEYTSGYDHTITVKNYAGGTGYTLSSAEHSTQSFGCSAPSRRLARRAFATGTCNGTGNYSLLDMWLKDFDNFFDQFFVDEYINPNNVVCETRGELPGSTESRTDTLSGSLTLQAGLQTSVSVSIPFIGVGFSVPLESTVATTVGHADTFSWTISNPDPYYKHYYKIYYEGGVIPHIWDVGKEYVGDPGGGGGGGGCPLLSVFNGTDYAYEGLLDIHDPNSTDVTAFRTLQTRPKPTHRNLLLRLTEHPQTISHIDQVKLYAQLADGRLIELKLASAVHSELGNVKPQLLFSDDWRVIELGADWNDGISQSIDLKFQLSPNVKAVGFVFQIEGHNPVWKL